MPPAPSGDTTSYGPSFVSEVRVIRARNYSRTNGHCRPDDSGWIVGQPEVIQKRASRKPADDLREADFWPASLKVVPGPNFGVTRQKEAARAADAAACIDTSVGTALLKNGWC